MPENINIKSDDLSPIAHGQAVVEARQALDGDCKVISVTATCAVTPGEVFAGEARYAGRVRFDCLVLTSGKLECMSAVAEFSDKIAAGEIAAGMNPVITAEIVNTESSVDGGTLKLNAVVDTTAYAVVHRDFTCLQQTDPGVYAEKRKVSYCTAVSEPVETAYITDALSDVKASEVLMSFTRVAVTDAVCGDDEVRISGATYTTVVVRTDDDLAASYRMVTPFVKSLSAPGVTPDSTAIGSASVTDSTATLTVDGEEKSIELSVTLRLAATVITHSEAEIASDVFCADNEIEIGYTDIALCSAEPLATVIDCVDGQVALDESRLAADNVLCVTNTFCTVTNATVDGRLNVEGLVGGDIVYYNAEKNAVDSIAFRLPFSMPLSIHTDSKNADVSAVVTDVSVRIRRESVFDVKAEIAFSARCTSCETVRTVQSVKIGDAISRPDATVIVHIAKPGETLWQAAKALCCSPERVNELNTAQAPYSGGERLIGFSDSVKRGA